MALFLAFSLKKRRFFVLKVEVLSARNSGFRTKKRWFLKLIHIFVGIKNIYHADYQYLLYNTQNKRFCHRRTTRLQISAVCMLRTAFLLILFASIVVTMFAVSTALCVYWWLSGGFPPPAAGHPSVVFFWYRLLKGKVAYR